jgi:hypothetical protein
VAIDDRSGDGEHADLAAAVARRMAVHPGVVMDGAIAARLILAVGPRKLGHAPAEHRPVADMIDQPGVERGARHVAIGRLDEAIGIGDISVDLRARTGLTYVLPPRPPKRVGERLGGGPRLG